MGTLHNHIAVISNFFLIFMSNMKLNFALVFLFVIFGGKFTAEGLKCFECKAEDKEKCYHGQSKGDDADPNDQSWFGEKVTCDDTATHCMTARTQMALNVAYELEWTYVRGCVSLGNNIDFGSKDCKKYPGESTETTVCFCNDEDYCNGSQNLISSNVIITLVVASILRYFA